MNSHISLLPKLMTCYEEQQLGNSEELERQQLLQLGIKTSSSLATSIVYRGINQILVAVSKDLSDIIVCTGSSQILLNLVQNKCVIPREIDYRIEQNLIENLTNETLNKYLKDDKFHFVNIQRGNSCLIGYKCKLYSFSPYPNFSNYNVYTLDAVSNYYKEVCDVLSKGYTKVLFGGKECLVYKLGVPIISSNVSNFVVLSSDFKVNVQNLSDIHHRFNIFIIRDLCPYALTDLESSARDGVVVIGDKYYTASLKVAKQYYLYYSSDIETTENKVRELINILTSSTPMCFEMAIACCGLAGNKSELFSCERNVAEYYSKGAFSNLNDVGEKGLMLRLLSPSLVRGEKKDKLYRLIKDESTISYEIADKDKVIPKSYLVWGVSRSFGYRVEPMRVESNGDLDYLLRREFIRRFGRVIEDVQYKNLSDCIYPRDVVTILTSSQQRIASSILSGNFSNNFREYYKLIADVLVQNNAKYYSEDSVKFLLINVLAKDIKKKRANGRVCLGDISVHLYKYVLYCANTEKSMHIKDLFNKMFRVTGVRKTVEARILDLESKKEDIINLGIKGDWLLSYSHKSKIAIIRLETLNYECSYNISVDGDNGIVLSERRE